MQSLLLFVLFSSFLFFFLLFLFFLGSLCKLLGCEVAAGQQVPVINKIVLAGGQRSRKHCGTAILCLSRFPPGELSLIGI
jgi:hypothetical protein